MGTFHHGGTEDTEKNSVISVSLWLSASGIRRRSGTGGGFQNLVDQFLQLFARLEVRNLLRRYFDFLTGLGVTAGARLAAAEAETAEAAELDLLAGTEGVDDGVEHNVDDGLGLLLGQLDDARDFVHQLRFGHHARFALALIFGFQ